MFKPKIYLPVLFCLAAGVLGLSFWHFENGGEETVQLAASSCSTASVSSTTLINTHHLRTDTSGYGIFPTKDGGYLLTGDTIWANAMAVPNPFTIKTNSKGSASWSKQYSSQSMPDSGYDIRRLAVETSDGNFITANNILDFIDAAYEKVLEVTGDILVTKLNSKGTKQWSIMLGDYSIDWVQDMWPTSDAGVILLARFMETGYGNDIADIDAVPKYSVLMIIDKNGKVLWTKKLNFEAIDMQYLSDGGFIALAEIRPPTIEEEGNPMGLETAIGDLPTVIRLDKNLNLLWAKSIEMIPSTINSSPTTTTTLRISGGDFQTVQAAPDGGFIAFGFANLLATQGLLGNLTGITSFSPQSFIAVKFDSAGNYLWAKKLTSDLIGGLGSNSLMVAKTTDSNFVMMRSMVRDSAGLQAKYNDAGEKAKLVTEKCKEYNCKLPGDEYEIPEVKPFAESSAAAAKLLDEAWATNIELIKTDADFNPRWIKQIDVERNLTWEDIQPTSDKGVAILGTIETRKQYYYLGSWYPYKEATLIKADVNGNVVLPSAVGFEMEGYVDVSSYDEATVEDQSSYLVTQNISVKAENYKLNVNKIVNEKVSTIKNTVRNIASYKKTNVVPVCSYLTSGGTSSGSDTTPTAKTWAQINYDNAKEDTLDGARATEIHEELLPILNQIFNNQVKMTDSLASMWQDYVFPRLVTRSDVVTVENYYKGLGYKIDSSEGGDLYVSRIGLTMHLDFSITSQLAGKLEVTY